MTTRTDDVMDVARGDTKLPLPLDRGPLITITLGFSVAREERRRRPGSNIMVDWARRWLSRHGMETTEPPTIYLDETGDDFIRNRKHFRFEMRVRPERPPKPPRGYGHGQFA